MNKAARLEAEILQAIGGDREITATEIRKQVGGSQTRVARALRRLMEDKKLERQGGGKKGSPYTYKWSKWARMKNPKTIWSGGRAYNNLLYDPDLDSEPN